MINSKPRLEDLHHGNLKFKIVDTTQTESTQGLHNNDKSDVV